MIFCEKPVPIFSHLALGPLKSRQTTQTGDDGTSEIFLIALTIIVAVPCAVWRLAKLGHRPR